MANEGQQGDKGEKGEPCIVGGIGSIGVQNNCTQFTNFPGEKGDAVC